MIVTLNNKINVDATNLFESWSKALKRQEKERNFHMFILAKVFKVKKTDLADYIHIEDRSTYAVLTHDGQGFMVKEEEFNNILKKEIEKNDAPEVINSPHKFKYKKRKLKDDRKLVCAKFLGINAKDVIYLSQHKNRIFVKTNDGKFHRVTTDEYAKAKEIYMKEEV